MNTINTALHAAAVSALVDAGTQTIKAQSAGAQLAKAISGLYADVNGSDDAFAAEFGNGRPPKAKDFIPGNLATDVKARIAKFDKARQESILATLKSRLTEVRALRKHGGMPAEGESIQQALKRYKAPAATPAHAAKDAPVVEEKVDVETFAKEASIEDVAELVSLWVANHGKAVPGLVAALKDSLPIVAKPTRKAA